MKRDNKAAIENVESESALPFGCLVVWLDRMVLKLMCEVGTVVTIKGTEYEIGDDELILDGDEKGDTKMDELGRLLGGKSLLFALCHGER